MNESMFEVYDKSMWVLFAMALMEFSLNFGVGSCNTRIFANITEADRNILFWRLQIYNWSD